MPDDRGLGELFGHKHGKHVLDKVWQQRIVGMPSRRIALPEPAQIRRENPEATAQSFNLPAPAKTVVWKPV